MDGEAMIFKFIFWVDSLCERLGHPQIPNFLHCWLGYGCLLGSIAEILDRRWGAGLYERDK